MSNAYYGFAPIPQPQVQNAKCDLCEEDLEMGEEAIAIEPGKMGIGPKSGMPMVVSTELYKDIPAIVKLHPWCGRAWLATHVCEEEEEYMEQFCQSCGHAIDLCRNCHERTRG